MSTFDLSKLTISSTAGDLREEENQTPNYFFFDFLGCFRCWFVYLFVCLCLFACLLVCLFVACRCLPPFSHSLRLPGAANAVCLQHISAPIESWRASSLWGVLSLHLCIIYCLLVYLQYIMLYYVYIISDIYHIKYRFFCFLFYDRLKVIHHSSSQAALSAEAPGDHWHLIHRGAWVGRRWRDQWVCGSTGRVAMSSLW